MKHEIKIDQESRRALKALGIELPEIETVADLTYGVDSRGDMAFFIERYHIRDWEIDSIAQMALYGAEATFFRVIDEGVMASAHGWIENGRIVQWG